MHHLDTNTKECSMANPGPHRR